MKGWIKVHRTSFDHDVFAGRPDWLGAWVMLLMKADHETGQFRASLATMQTWFNWTPKRVRVFLQKLEENGMIDRASNEAKKGTKGAQITICNYSRFQQDEKSKGHSEVTNRASKGQQEKNQEEEPRTSRDMFDDRFDEFWNAFADKRDRPNAEKAWREAIKRASPDEIIEGAKKYRSWMKAKGKNAPNPKMAQGWLNDSRWQDELQINGAGKLTADQMAGKSRTEIMRMMGIN